ncbi:hypothetical protein Nocox_39530 [Nonomuraea coxensis DSM 45129]|uniref:Thoeris protein ThsA Macro domain-containing protein n=1 Tax=Nonomuraea coxensis DSM 45129 TaxID=1122611 RepID=A0ABX8UCH7_9ACTN|nr:macro domain-containing protein [Nonomuraea coxensis]QYC45453.1 hypothetical protein Nocox_39530 [Nonomuraea coxensis DSM 45129]
MTARPDQPFRTPGGRARLARRFFLAFGVVSVVLVVALAYGVPFGPLWVALAVAGCLAWALIRDRPRPEAVRRVAGATVVVRAGDLLAEPGELVVGCGDTFDLDAGSLGPAYDGGPERLEEELDLALATRVPTSVESREAKPEGRLRRYPIGTVAVLGGGGRRVHCLACTRMGAAPSLDDLWTALGRLWTAVRDSGAERVAVPLLGAELPIGRDVLVRLIVLSFEAQAQVAPVCRELVVVVPPGENLDLPDLGTNF